MAEWRGGELRGLWCVVRESVGRVAGRQFARRIETSVVREHVVRESVGRVAGRQFARRIETSVVRGA